MPRSRKSRAIPLLPLWAFTACYGSIFFFIIINYTMTASSVRRTNTALSAVRIAHFNAKRYCTLVLGVNSCSKDLKKHRTPATSLSHGLHNFALLPHLQRQSTEQEFSTFWLRFHYCHSKTASNKDGITVYRRPTGYSTTLSA